MELRKVDTELGVKRYNSELKKPVGLFKSKIVITVKNHKVKIKMKIQRDFEQIKIGITNVI
jgi:hypothetical protein